MSKHVNNFEQHQIHQNLKNCMNEIESAANIDNINNDYNETINRAKQIIETLISILKKTDPYLVTIELLNNINNSIINITNNLQNYLKQEERNRQTYIDNINNISNSIIQQLNIIYYPRTSEDIQDLSSSITSFRKSISLLNSNMQKDYNNLKVIKNNIEDELNKLKNSIQSQEDRIVNINAKSEETITNFNDKFRNGQNDRDDIFKRKIEEYNNEVKASVMEWQDELENLHKNSQEKILEIEKQNEDRFEKIKNTINNKSLEYMNTFNEKIKDVEKIIGAISNNAHSFEYKRYAQQDKHTKWLWQFLTVVGLTGLIGFAFLASLHVYDNQYNINWSIIITKWFVALSCGSFAAYAGKQASNYYNSEKINRKMELELATLNPYLIGLEEKDIKDIKVKLVNEFFGNIDFPKITKGNSQNQINSEQLQNFIENCGKIAATIDKIN